MVGDFLDELSESVHSISVTPPRATIHFISPPFQYQCLACSPSCHLQFQFRFYINALLENVISYLPPT